MSEFLTIGLSKHIIFDKIGLFSSYLAGKRSEDYVGYDKVAVQSADLPVLDYIVEDAASLLAAEIGDKVAEFKIEGDVMRYVLRNPFYGLEASAGGMPERGWLLNVMESYLVAATIIRWLQIVGYEFGEGTKQALVSAAEVAATKLKLLQGALTNPKAKSEEAEEWQPAVKRARRRRIPPL